MSIRTNDQAQTILIGLFFWIGLIIIVYSSISATPFAILESQFDGPANVREAAPSILIRPNHRWDSHVYIFVGGIHGSGTTVTERLLSSQSFASGLQINDREISNTGGCRYTSAEKPKSCISPENEGLFVTRAFHQLYTNRGTNCKIYGSEYWGECAIAQHLTEKDIIHEHNTRSRLFIDWKQFWELNVPFLIEKDIPNLVRSRLLQELFGLQRTAFVFTLRHPMATCKRFICDVRRHVKAWLTAYSLMETDLAQLRHYIVLHMEGYTQQPKTIISALEEFLQWEKIQYQIGSITVMATSNAEPKKAKVTVQNPSSSEIPLNLRTKDDKKSDPRVHRNIMVSGGGGGIGMRQLLGFHGDDKATIKHAKNINQSEVVSLSRSAATIQWEANYAAYLQANVTVRKALLPFERRLRRFCYSVHTLQPVCSSYVWRRSERSLPRVRILNASEYKEAQMLAEQNRLDMLQESIRSFTEDTP